MLLRFLKLCLAVSLLVAMWGLSRVRESDAAAWLRPIGSQPGPVRILQFYASVGTLTIGQKALLCYGVQNARSVRLSPAMAGIYPSSSRCVEVGPEHTTHYVLLAEGFDGRVTTRSLTLPVQTAPVTPQILNYALVEPFVSAESPAAPTGARAVKT